MASDNSEIDAKLDYLSDTKFLIKRALNNKGASVTDDVTFREYASILDNLEIADDQSDATANPEDIVKNKIAYNNNNRIVGTLSENSQISSEASNVTDDTINEQVKGKFVLDNRLLLGRNASIEIIIPYNRINSYNTTLQQLNDLLGL